MISIIKNVSRINGFLKEQLIRIIFIGDSITRGIGTYGTGSSFGGDIGNTTYPKSTMNRLANKNLSSQIYAYPGMTAQWFIDNRLTSVINALSDEFDLNISPIFFGANEINDVSISPTQIYNSIKYIHDQLKLNGVKTIVVPILNRIDSLAVPETDARRLAVNALLRANWMSFADGYAELENQPNIYLSDAPNNPKYFAFMDADGLSKLHPTTDGAYLIAIEVSKNIFNLIPTT